MSEKELVESSSANPESEELKPYQSVNPEHYDRDTLIQFLDLFLHKYQVADQANYFLEGNLGISGVNLSIANQRDAVSHFISFLRNPVEEVPTEEQKAFWRAQVDSSEEHLRRAIMEPYQIAVSIKRKSIISLLEEYSSTLKSYDENPLNDSELQPVLDEIQSLYADGRSKKTQNSWNSEWEEGTKDLTIAFEMASNLQVELEERCLHLRKIASRKNKSQLTLMLTVLGFAVGCVVTATLLLILK